MIGQQLSEMQRRANIFHVTLARVFKIWRFSLQNYRNLDRNSTKYDSVQNRLRRGDIYILNYNRLPPYGVKAEVYIKAVVSHLSQQLNDMTSSNLMRQAPPAPRVHIPGANLRPSDDPFPRRAGTGFDPRHSTHARPRRVQVTI